MSRKKVYVLTVSTLFQKTHPRAGEPTGFVQSILDTFHPNTPPGKIHTLRDNYEYWKGIADKVNSGRGILSLRTWAGVPYQSKQNEFADFSAFGIQKVVVSQSPGGLHIEDKIYSLEEVAKNDGLSRKDFVNWFFPGIKPQKKTVACIHFTDFRY